MKITNFKVCNCVSTGHGQFSLEILTALHILKVFHFHSDLNYPIPMHI